MQESTVDIDELPVAVAGLVAVIGCDGSGKTSLTKDLEAILRNDGPVERRYLGTVSGETGDKIKRLPVIGIRLEHYLAAKARRAQDTRKKLPGTGTALLMYLFSLRRRHHIRELLALSRRGVVVIADRFPQAQIPGFHYDGTGLSGPHGDNWMIRKLAAKERELYRWMASHIPSLVIRLNIDLETALARKPDHNSVELRDKIAVASKLGFNGARIVDIDARAPYPQVLDATLKAVRESLGIVPPGVDLP
ncbi:MAG: hypothetical protein GY910_24325 [bacterium]|nr:hypothetical protein [Deltaproteobacteria bacterium]MCP4908110.1 hypothetical protein [bacterium]